MPGAVCSFLAADHARLDALLRRSFAGDDAVDHVAYAAFRAGLLKHIGMEEKILLPAARRWRGGAPLPVAATLRLQHGALAALLVSTPTAVTGRILRAVLAAHNPIEEGGGGVYETVERLGGTEVEALLGRLRGAPEVAVSAYADGPKIIAATVRALERAGFRRETARTNPYYVPDLCPAMRSRR